MISIYCISAPEVGRFKIGRTQNVAGRLRVMQTGSPIALQVVATTVVPAGSDPAAFEKVFQGLVLSKGFTSLHGEWFSGTLTATDFQLIASEASIGRLQRCTPARRRSYARQERAAR